MSFAKALAFTFKEEGGLANVTDDAGGLTKYGIADMRDHVPDGMTDVDGDGKPDTRIKDLTREQAAEIYFRDYWLECACNRLPEPLDLLVFDAAVNHSPTLALKFFTRAGGDLQDYGTTLPTCKDYIDQREAFYKMLVVAKPTQQKFLKGWLKRIADCRAVAGLA